MEETVGGMMERGKEGKVRHIALSGAGPDTLRRAAQAAPIAALQSEYSIWEREVEAEILPVCREHGIGFVPYSPLGRGFLTGTVRSRDELPEHDWRRNDPRYSDENRSEEHTSELQSLMRISYAVFCLNKKKTKR